MTRPTARASCSQPRTWSPRRRSSTSPAQPAYTDEYGTWISTYTPIVDDAGTTVGVLGVDYSLSYVNDVRGNVLRVLYPVFGAAYVVLLLIVLALSQRLTRRLARLSAVTRRVADGEYDIDLSSVAHSRFPDEMNALARAFAVMTEKVGKRERSLVQQVRVLKVEIDQEKRKRAVDEITETEFFATLTSTAAAMRAKIRDSEGPSPNNEDHLT
jgi:methyl-accepting chemotaxis protein